MAQVLNPCGKGRKKLPKDDQSRDGVDNYVLTMLNNLPPSKELLQHYQSKLEQYEEEENLLLERINACYRLLDSTHGLESELAAKESLVARMQQDLDSLAGELRRERRRCQQLEAESSHRKHQQGNKENTTRPSSATRGSSLRSSTEQEQRIKFLEQQIITQEKLHKAELQAEQEARLEAERRLGGEAVATRQRLTEARDKLTGLQGQVEQLSRVIVEERKRHRSHETEWLKDRTHLTRKIQFLERYGDLGSGKRLGENTEERLHTRVSGEKALRGKVSQLETELETSEAAAQKLRVELAAATSERRGLEEQIQAQGESYGKRSKKMSGEVEILKDRCEKTESRRRTEAAGYQADIRILREKMNRLEETIIAITMSKAKEEENVRLLSELRDELKDGDRKKPRQWIP